MLVTSEKFSQNFKCQHVSNNGLIYPSTGQTFEKSNGDFQAASFIILMEWFVSGLQPAEFVVGSWIRTLEFLLVVKPEQRGPH